MAKELGVTTVACPVCGQGMTVQVVQWEMGAPGVGV